MAALAIVIAGITAQHYLVGVSHENISLHNIHYLLYFLPILMASIWYGLLGGIVMAALVSVLYAPVVFGPLGRHVFASGGQNVLELVIYNVVGWVTGFLSERERREREGYRRTAEELHKAYERLREQTDLIVEKEQQLHRAERLTTLGELAAGIAHEIRNPLAAIKGTVEILQDPATPRSKRNEFMRLMLDEVNHLDRVVGNVLRLARLQKLNREKGNINGIIERMLQILDPQLKRNSIGVRARFGPDIPELEIDISQMEQAILNLILNAVAAMPDGGTLDLTTELQERDGQAKILVEITDTGAGIEADHLARIFDPFFTTRPEGTGLGLPIVRRILKAHGGSAEISSETGHGTCATLTLPVNSENMQ